MPDETPAQKQEREAREKAQREAREKAQREQQRSAQPNPQTANQQPTTPKGGTVHKSLAYTPGQRGEQQIGDPRGDTFLLPDEIKSLAGDIGPGEVGYIELDEEGTPTGAAVRDIPPPGDHKMWARVIGASTHKYDEIVTPSGAPVTKYMNPEPTLWDEGMLARNPVDAETQKRADEHGQGQAGVVNKPGTV